MAISDNASMFYGDKPEIFEKASILRGNMTQTEKLLWEKLKDRNLFTHKFRRQHPIDIFIADFYSHPIRLAIEIDGGYLLKSEQREYDEGRTGELENWGIKVIRFSNKEVAESIDFVVERIKFEIKKRKKELNLK